MIVRSTSRKAGEIGWFLMQNVTNCCVLRVALSATLSARFLVGQVRCRVHDLLLLVVSDEVALQPLDVVDGLEHHVQLGDVLLGADGRHDPLQLVERRVLRHAAAVHRRRRQHGVLLEHLPRRLLARSRRRGSLHHDHVGKLVVFGDPGDVFVRVSDAKARERMRMTTAGRPAGTVAAGRRRRGRARERPPPPPPPPPRGVFKVRTARRGAYGRSEEEEQMLLTRSPTAFPARNQRGQHLVHFGAIKPVSVLDDTPPSLTCRPQLLARQLCCFGGGTRCPCSGSRWARSWAKASSMSRTGTPWLCRASPEPPWLSCRWRRAR